MVLALGITLMLGGMITHAILSVLGALLAIIASVGWFRNVLPHEQHEDVLVRITAADRSISEAVEPDAPAPTTKALQRSYSFVSGIEAGLAGGTAMGLVAMIFSLIRFHSFWYATNLMAASSFLSWTNAEDAFLSSFHLEGLLVALAIHIFISVLIGLLYASIVPIFPRLAVVTGGLVTPLVWTALAYSVMDSVTPVLAARVDWPWFIISQIAFGLTAVAVVSLRVRVRSAEFRALSFDQRAGLHSNDTQPPTSKEEQQ
jgi:hypothetical protein